MGGKGLYRPSSIPTWPLDTRLWGNSPLMLTSLMEDKVYYENKLKKLPLTSQKKPHGGQLVSRNNPQASCIPKTNWSQCLLLPGPK